MHINKTQRSIKKPIVFITAGAFLVVGIFVYAWFSPNVSFIGTKPDAPENTVNTKPTTDEQKKAGYAAKEAFVDEKYGEDAKKPSNPDSAGDTSVSLTSIGQADGFLQVRAIISTTLSEGQCVLKVSNNSGKTIERTSSLQSMGSYTVCQGFDVAESEFSSGDWTVEVSYVLNASTSGKASKVFEVVR